MLPAANAHSHYNFFDLYDKHSPVLFGMLMKLTGSTAEAESILVETFQKLHREKESMAAYNHCMQAHLLKLTVNIAYKRQFTKTNFLNNFNNLPLLYRLMIGNIDAVAISEAPAVNCFEQGKKIALALQQAAREKALSLSSN